MTLSYSGTGATTYGPSATAPTECGHVPGRCPYRRRWQQRRDSGGAHDRQGESHRYGDRRLVPRTGNPRAGAGSAVGGGGESLTVTLTYTGTGSTTYGPSATAPTNAGTYQVVAHTDGDGNNNPGDSTAGSTGDRGTWNHSDGTAARCVCLHGSPRAGSGSAVGQARAPSSKPPKWTAGRERPSMDHRRLPPRMRAHTRSWRIRTATATTVLPILHPQR